MANSRITVDLEVKYKWFFYPVAFTCVALGRGIPKWCISVKLSSPRAV
jgi:hypothetical protein